MNGENRFDEMVRRALENCSQPVPEGAWDNILKTLERRRRWRVVRRTAYAAAACLAAVLLVSSIVDGSSAVFPTTDSVAGLAVVSEDSSSDRQQFVAEESDVQSIDSQLSTLPEGIADASGASSRKIHSSFEMTSDSPAASVKSSKALATSTEPSDSPAASANESDSLASSVKSSDTQAVSVNVSNAHAASTGSSDASAASEKVSISSDEGYLTENDLPYGYWDEEEKTEHTSQIAILSNISSRASGVNPVEDGSRFFTGGLNGGGKDLASVALLGDAPHFDIPLTFGLQFKTGLGGEKLSLGAGVSYTYLVSEYSATVNNKVYKEVYNQQHYLGIPISLYYDILQDNDWNLYASVGGEAARCVSQRYVYGSNTLKEKIEGVQFSASIGLGVEYWFLSQWGLYLDPSLAYYFDCDQPLSIRTQQPLQVRAEIGFRYRF